MTPKNEADLLTDLTYLITAVAGDDPPRRDTRLDGTLDPLATH